MLLAKEIVAFFVWIKEMNEKCVGPNKIKSMHISFVSSLQSNQQNAIAICGSIEPEFGGRGSTVKKERISKIG